MYKQWVLSIIDEMHTDISRYKESIERLEEEKLLVKDFNNSVEDKIENINYLQESIDEYNELLVEINAAVCFMYNIYDMLEEARDTKYDSDNPSWLDEDKYVYVGIECYRPTINDIKE